MITDPQAARLSEAIVPGFAWHQEAAADERLRLGKRWRRWLTLTYLAQIRQPIPSHLQGAAVPSPKAALRMEDLGLIQFPEDQAELTHWFRDYTVTRDGQAAVTWWHNVWAPMTCAPTWGLPILCAIPGNDRWPDRFYAIRAEKRGDELVWITPNSGASFYDKWTDGVWRAIP